MPGSFRELPARILTFLAKGPGHIAKAAQGGKVLIEAGERGTVSIEGDVLRWLVAEGIVTVRGTGISLSQTGLEIARDLAAARLSGNGGRETGVMCVDADGGSRPILVNLSESPLAQLARLRTKAGKPFLARREFEAGERLRADYTRGQIMPRLGANWIASVASGKRAGAGGVTELTDAALAARLRVEKAIAAVGPELSGVLIDVCCFLKGMETVEVERAWPVRSGKVVLKTALSALARHYWPNASCDKDRPSRMLHWGAQDYKPSMHGP